MPEALRLFDPRRNFQLQGFSGRGATTTLHDASATGVSISGIFQAAEDFAVLEWFNAFDYYNHLRCKPLPRTDLSGLTLAFTLEMDRALDGAVQIGSQKYPSVAWDSMIFFVGPQMHSWMVKLTDYAEVQSGSIQAATAMLTIEGAGDIGILHIYFRDARYTVDVEGIVDATPELVAQTFADAINNDTAYGGNGLGWLSAEASGTRLIVTFNGWGPDGNEDCLYFSHSGPSTYSFSGSDGVFVSYGHVRFTGGDDARVYRITIPMDTVEGSATVGGAKSHFDTSDIRRIVTTYAPRFENVEQELEDGCFLAVGVDESATAWQVDSGHALTGGRYFIGNGQNEERVFLIAGGGASIGVQRGYEGSTPRSWPVGSRMAKLSPVTGFSSDIEWRAAVSNIQVTGDASLKVGGDSVRIEETDRRCAYTGHWEEYKYSASGWPSQWWSGGHAKRTAPNDASDVRKVVLSYSNPAVHDLYLGTFLNIDCGKVAVSVDGVTTTHDLYQNQYGGTAACLKVRSNVAPGNHTVVITALFDRNEASTGYYFYFDYLWPLVAQDVPDAPKEYTDISLAVDFDTDHGYKKPPAWHLWHLQKLGFLGHADVYMGVFWNNKRRRVGATYPSCTIEFVGDAETATYQDVTITVGGTAIKVNIGYGEDLQNLCNRFRSTLNAIFAGIWCDNNYGTSTTLTIRSKSPSWTFPIAVKNSTVPGGATTDSVRLVLTQGTPDMETAGADGDWEILDSASPVMTEGARKWIRDLASQFATAGIPASFAFSMEVYNPPAAMRAKYLRNVGGVVQPGADVYLDVPSHQMHFGTRVRNYLKQMYKECADQIAAAGLPVVLQFGETQYWYFDNRAADSQGGMPFYDQETISAFAAAKGHQIWPFAANTDDPAGDPAHPYETASFLRDRIWAYCQDVISYVRAYHPTALFECLWPLDANQGKPSPSSGYRKLLMYVNLPDQWKNSSYGIKYFRCEGFDYDIWQKNANLMRQTLTFARKTLGRPADECMYLAGLYGPPDPPMAQAYGIWLQAPLNSLCFWAFDQFCLNSRPVPLQVGVQTQMQATAAVYHKPTIARAAEVATAIDVVAPTGGALNRFKGNERKLND
jgi:hypothetical protein